MKKQKRHRKIPALAAGTTLVAAMTLMASCSTDYEDKIVYNDIQQPFQQNFRKDTVAFDKLPAEFAKHILNQGRRIKLRCPPKVLTGTLHPSLPSIFSG